MTQETKIGVIRSFMGEELTLQEKLTIVRKRYHEHKQQKTIARELCCNQSTVSRVLQQFLSSDGLETKKRSGRPSVVSDEVKGVVDKGIKKRRTATSSELANEVLDKTGRRVSERTIRRLRHELTYYPVHASVKPFMTHTRLLGSRGVANIAGIALWMRWELVSITTGSSFGSSLAKLDQ